MWMGKLSPSTVSPSSLMEVMSTSPIHNSGTRFTSIMSASAAHYETIVRVDSGVPSTRAEWQGQAQQQSGEAAWLAERVESAQFLLQAILNTTGTVNGIPDLDAYLSKVLRQ